MFLTCIPSTSEYATIQLTIENIAHDCGSRKCDGAPSDEGPNSLDVIIDAAYFGFLEGVAARSACFFPSRANTLAGFFERLAL